MNVNQHPGKPTILDVLNAIDFVQYLNGAISIAARSDAVEGSTADALFALTQVVDEKLQHVEAMLGKIMSSEHFGGEEP